MPNVNSECDRHAAPATDGVPTRRSVALIMPVRNEQDVVASTLDAVFASSRLPDEIIVADGQSSDATRTALQAYAGRGVPLTVLANPGIFAGAGRNVAATAAHSELLLFLDFGNRIEPGWIAAMALPFECDAQVQAVGGLYLPEPCNDFELCVAVVQYHESLAFARLSRAQQRARVPARIRLGGLGMAVTRAQYAALGGMPDWLRAAEDNLFGHKLSDSGARIAAALDAVVHHHMRHTLGAVWRQNLTYARGQGRVGLPPSRWGRVLGVHAGLPAAALVAWATWPLGAWLPLLAWLAYLGGVAWRRLCASGAQPSRIGCAWHLPRIVAVKELGAAAGYLWGCAERCCQPRWRERYRAYMAPQHRP